MPSPPHFFSFLMRFYESKLLSTNFNPTRRLPRWFTSKPSSFVFLLLNFPCTVSCAVLYQRLHLLLIQPSLFYIYGDTCHSTFSCCSLCFQHTIACIPIPIKVIFSYNPSFNFVDCQFYNSGACDKTPGLINC